MTADESDDFGQILVRLDETPPWSIPWIAPTSDVARSALAALDRPLRAWSTGFYFDPDDFYSGADRPLLPVERKVRAAGPRVEWRTECVHLPDEESSAAESAEYESRIVTVEGFRINPRCLDDYTTIAYQYASRAGWADPEDGGDDDPDVESPVFNTALEWAAAGVCVLQQSLPWPFMDCLPYAVIDNRPAHRILYAYASLLAGKHPRLAAKWFRSLVFINPPDNMGARFYRERGGWE
jgi:hypothetical protein